MNIMKKTIGMFLLVGASFVFIAPTAECNAIASNGTGVGISVRCDYPGGNVRLLGIDETIGVIRVAPDVRDTAGNYSHWDFTVCGAAGRTIHFQFPNDKIPPLKSSEYLATLGPAISRDGGATWKWFRQDGKRHEPANAFDYSFAPDENETRFAVSIPYTQKNWDEAAVRWHGKDGVKFDVLCKSQSGQRDTELLRIPCRNGKAKWLFAFTARHHACETTASPIMEGIIDQVLSGSPESEWIRDNADCVFIPFMDKDGVENGDQGKNRRPHDHNRDYFAGLYTSVRAFKELLVRESHGKRIVFFDLHSPHVRTLEKGSKVHDHIFTMDSFKPENTARWMDFRRHWMEAQKGGTLVYDGKFDSFLKDKGKKAHDSNLAKGLSTSRCWVQDLSNCWMAICCEFGYSLCGGVYSREAGRELGNSLLKAAVRTVSDKQQKEHN